MNDTPRIDRGFLSRLEWQLRSEFRRQEAFYSNGDRLRRFRRLLIPIAALAVGFAAATATQRYSDSGREELLLAQARATIELTEARWQLAREYQDEWFEKNPDDPEVELGLAHSQMELNQIERDLRRAQFDLREIEESGVAPRNKLTDPVINGTDYVSMRLRLGLDSSLERLSLIEQDFARFLREPPIDAEEIQVKDFEMEVARVRSTANRVRERLRLREAFLNGQLSAQEVAIQSELADASERLHNAQSRRQTLQDQLHLFQTEAGELTHLQFKEARFELTQAEVEERLAVLEYKFLQKKIADLR